MPDRKRINLYFTDEEDEELYGRIATIAAKEKRSISQTAKLLIVAALTTIADRRDEASDIVLRAQPQPAASKDNGKGKGKRNPKPDQE